ncbi:MAG TPA: hypothetical protein VJV79_32860 [Polyangiaceae bacterium]|nr:hypothetical protein [Polyangiaceae bacterium]
MTSDREIALRLASVAVPLMVEELDRLIESACVGLPRSEADQLSQAAARSRAATLDLGRLLVGATTRAEVENADGVDGCTAPRMDKERATLVVRDLDALIRSIDHEIFQPLKRGPLGEDELRQVARQVGEVWRWIIDDLQEPLWRQYPELGPSEG